MTARQLIIKLLERTESLDNEILLVHKDSECDYKYQELDMCIFYEEFDENDKAIGLVSKGEDL